MELDDPEPPPNHDGAANGRRPGVVDDAHVLRPPPSRSPGKGRSLSDLPPMLSPSPKLREPARATRDDSFVSLQPVTPRRPKFPVRGLSLQMPPGDGRSVSPGPSTLAHLPVPLSPTLDLAPIYGSPSSVLPRRSRGLDFSRACTNLHHSTLAEPSSPDLSPTLSGRGMMIPPRKGPPPHAHPHESPGSNPGSWWSHTAVPARRPTAGSVSSVNMLESDSSGSTSEEDELMDHDDPADGILTTPQVYKLEPPALQLSTSNPFAAAAAAQVSPGRDWMGRYSPAAASLLSFQRARLRHGRSRKRSSSASASVSASASASASASGGSGSAMASPSPASPPVAKSIETIHGYFGRDPVAMAGPSRRSSLSWGTKELHISSGGESDESPASAVDPSTDAHDPITPITPGGEEKHGVIRRPVTRRGNLLVRQP